MKFKVMHNRFQMILRYFRIFENSTYQSVKRNLENGQNKEFIKNYSNNTPMNRMMHKDEIIGISKFLASDESSYTTGSLLKIDGGWSSW